VSLSYASDDLFNFEGVEVDYVVVSTGQGTTGFEPDGDTLDGWTVPGIWLNEGFATYTEWLWSEHEGQATAQEIFDSYAAIPADDPFWSLTIGDPGPDNLFAGQVYGRAAATLHALRMRIGDDAFFRLLHRWVRENAGGNVTTPQFIGLAERISGQALGEFFDEWLFTPARPASLPAQQAAARRLAPARAPAAREKLHFSRQM
jgi:hypothetical protein